MTTKLRSAVVAAAAVWLTGGAAMFVSDRCSAAPPHAGPLVLAHRGAPGYLPEHTLAGVAMAHALGADFIEPDVVLTADGCAIVLHDITLEATTNVAAVFPGRADAKGRYPAANFTLAEIRQLSAGERRARPNGPARFPGRFPLDAEVTMRVPTLAEELALVEGLNRSTGRAVGVIVEIKDPAWHRERGLDVTAATLRVLAEHGYRERDDAVIVQCFDGAEVRRMREQLGCKLRLCHTLGGKVPPSPEMLREIAKYADSIAPSYDLLLDGRGESRGLAEAAHAVGLEVYAYTVRRDALPKFADNVSELLGKLTELRVDGYFTDFPDDRPPAPPASQAMLMDRRR